MVFLVPITLFLSIAAIPIVAILVNHQQKMAQILRSGQNNEILDELRSIRGEMQVLTDRVNQLAIDQDRTSSLNYQNLSQTPPPPPQEVRAREAAHENA
jgi:hypothetical protein